jgi:GNAT superfamily N-acetyltransferase
MINWNETYLRFGYKKTDFIPNKLKIVLACDDCGIEILGTREKHSRIIRRRGKLRCHNCGLKAIKEKWKNPNYIAKQKSKRHSDEYKKIASDRSISLWKEDNYKNKFWSNFNSNLAIFNLKNGDPNHSKSKAGLKKYWENNEEAKSKLSLWSKSMWNNDEYKNKVINGLKNYYNNPLILEKLSNKAKQLWLNNDYRNKWLKSFLNSFDEDRLEEISKQSFKNWNNDKYRSKIEDHWTDDKRKWMSEICRIWWTDEKRSEISDRMIELWSDIDTRNMFIEAFKKSWTEERRKSVRESWTDEMRQSARERTLALWTNPDYIQKHLDMIGRPSSLEIQLASVLQDYNVKFKQQSHIGPYLFDFELDNGNLIEVQGDYWHTLKDAVAKDKSKATYINKYFPSKKLYYIWEHEFYELNKINEFVKMLSGSNNVIDFNFSDLIFDSDVDYNEAKSLIEKYHYKGIIGRSGMIFGVRYNNNLIAAAIFSSPTRNVYGGELTRFVIDQRYQKKNLASWLLSRATKLAIKKYNYVFTFADPNHNHSGTIYEASNWKYAGDTKSDYWYVSENGWVMHKKTLWNRAVNMQITEKEYAQKFGYNKVWGLPKKKYEFGNK